MLENESRFDSDLEIFPTWHFKNSILPPRSSLFSLPPINVRTSDVESLTSYISRISFEYLISPTSLLTYVLPKNAVLQIDIEEAKKIPLSNSINGMEMLTNALVKVLQQATIRDDLCFTTLLAWKDKISDKNLFHSHKLWRPVCFFEQKKELGFNYEKLIWALKAIKKCLKHRISLKNKCSKCNRLIKVISGSSRPGYCSNCFSWLGEKSSLFTEKDSISPYRDFLGYSQLGKIIEKSLLAKSSLGNLQFIKNLSNLIEQTTAGNINEFADQVKTWHGHIRLLLKGSLLPTWEVLFNFSHHTGVQLTSMLVEDQLELSKRDSQYANPISQIKSNVEELADLINPNDKNLKKIIEICIFEYRRPPLLK